MESKVTEFKKFLMNNNTKSLYVIYYNERKRKATKKLTLLTFFKNIDKSGWLDCAFQWHKTFEGYDFWENLNIKWQNQLNEKEKER